MAEFEPYNEEWEREMMRLPKPVLIKLYKEACLRNNDSVPFDKPVKPEIADIDAIIKDAFNEGESWGTCYGGWFEPTDQRHKEEFEESKNKIKEKYGL